MDPLVRGVATGKDRRAIRAAMDEAEAKAAGAPPPAPAPVPETYDATDGAAELMAEKRIIPGRRHRFRRGGAHRQGRCRGLAEREGERLMPRKSIEEATAAEIREFAATQGLDIHHNANKPTAAQRLRGVWSEDWIEVSDTPPAPDPAPEPVPPAPARAAAPVLEGDDFERAWYLIEIPLDPKGGIDQMVQVGVNGAILNIKRGVQSEIRAPYLEVLKNSVERKDYQEDPDDIRSEIKSAYVPGYPFSILRGPYFKDEHGEAIAA